MIRLGILGASEIAFRRFMPAVKDLNDSIEVAVVGEEYNRSKLDEFCNTYNVEKSSSFDSILSRTDIDAVYIPQPPALHFKWAKKALENGKHVFVEKPSTTSFEDSGKLVNLARENSLVLHENYMFKYHSQIRYVRELLERRVIGDTRIIRANFAFPFRTSNDFRYNRSLGGGALLDAGGYTVKLMTILLGEEIEVKTASLDMSSQYDVDITGTATLENRAGLIGQIYFSMDSFYQCSLEIIGEKGRIYTNRIFTAPPDLKPVISIETNDGKQDIVLEADSHFRHSIEDFILQVERPETRSRSYDEILLQSKIIDEIKACSTH